MPHGGRRQKLIQVNRSAGFWHVAGAIKGTFVSETFRGGKPSLAKPLFAIVFDINVFISVFLDFS
jgi:hypothetical protein